MGISVSLLLWFHKLFKMKRFLKIVLLCIVVLLTNPFSAFAESDDASSEAVVDWNSVIKAIIEVESSGDSKAKSGNSVGAMQITPVLVAECNGILRKKKSKKRFKLSDRFSIAKSKEMFLIIQSFYNPMNNIEKAIRSWNGGINYNMRRTQRYFEKVMQAMN